MPNDNHPNDSIPMHASQKEAGSRQISVQRTCTQTPKTDKRRMTSGTFQRTFIIAATLCLLSCIIGLSDALRLRRAGQPVGARRMGDGPDEARHLNEAAHVLARRQGQQPGQKITVGVAAKKTTAKGAAASAAPKTTTSTTTKTKAPVATSRTTVTVTVTAPENIVTQIATTIVSTIISTGIPNP